MLNASQISTIINEVYDGVERSKVGKIMEECEVSERYPDGKKLNNIPFQTYLSILTSLVPKDMTAEMKLKE